MSDDTTQVVINDKFGGFGLSLKAIKWLIVNRDWEVTEYDDGGVKDDTADVIDTGNSPDDVMPKYRLVADKRNGEFRANQDLIDVVDELGEDANGKHADLKIVEVPADVKWELKEYDGNEWIAEEHRTWS